MLRRGRQYFVHYFLRPGQKRLLQPTVHSPQSTVHSPQPIARPHSTPQTRRLSTAAHTGCRCALPLAGGVVCRSISAFGSGEASLAQPRPDPKATTPWVTPSLLGHSQPPTTTHNHTQPYMATHNHTQKPTGTKSTAYCTLRPAPRAFLFTSTRSTLYLFYLFILRK